MIDSCNKKNIYYSGFVDGFSLDNEKICGWVQNKFKNNIWISLENSSCNFNFNCNKFRVDKFHNGDDPYCGFEIHSDLILEKLKSTKNIILSFDRDKKHLLPGLKQPISFPKIIYKNFLKELESQILNGNDSIPMKASNIFANLRSYAGYYRDWVAFNNLDSHPNLHYPELKALTICKVKNIKINPFNYQIPESIKKYIFIKDIQEFPKIELSEQKESKKYITKILSINNTSIPEEFPPPFRQLIINKSSKIVQETSVIIPTWNRSKTIIRAIDSALFQTITPLEVIVCDDGSTDDTLFKIKNRYPNSLKRKKLKIIKDSHKGVSKARNNGLSAAKGNYFAYLDSDNQWHCDHLIYLAFFLTYKKIYDISYSTYKIFGERVKDKIIPIKLFNYSELEKYNYIDLNCVLHHRSLFDKLGGFDTSLKRLVDWELILKFTQNTLTTKVIPVNIATVNYWISKKFLSNISYNEEVNALNYVHINKILKKRK